MTACADRPNHTLAMEPQSNNIATSVAQQGSLRSIVVGLLIPWIARCCSWPLCYLLCDVAKTNSCPENKNMHSMIGCM